MSVQAMSWVFDHSESELAARLVLLSIANHCDAHGRNAFPSQELIAEEAHVSVRTVKRCIVALAEAGELTVENRKGAAVGRARTNYYELPEFIAHLEATKGQSVHERRGDTAAPEPADEVPSDARRGDIRADEVPAVAPHEPSSEPSENRQPTSALAEVRDEVVDLCNHLADRIVANGSKRPTITDRWLNACRLMIDRDGRTPDQIRRAIDWCQDDEFWRANVLSMPTLRSRYDQLRLAAKRPKHRESAQDRKRRELLEHVRAEAQSEAIAALGKGAA